ncbi:MAG: AAA family ATPase [Elusimicrobia bacterium]|nr:AAA family ATPase [Elusimicrobiota bacterium]
MSDQVSVTEVERELVTARRLVTASRLPGALAAVDAGAFGTTPLNLEALEELARAAASALAVGRLPRAAAAGGVFLGYVLAEHGALRLAKLAQNHAGAEPAGALPSNEYRDLADKRAVEDVARSVLRDAAAFLDFYRQHPVLEKRPKRDTEAVLCLRSYFRLLANSLRRLGSEREDTEVLTPDLKVQGYKATPAASEEPTGLLKISLDDVVGNDEFVKIGKRLVRDIAGFDLARGENPKKVRNQILFVLGTPGCGKTITSHALMNHFLDICKEAGTPAQARVIRRTDWASSYQNASAAKLLEIFKTEVFEAPGVAGVYWPDIDTAFAARGDQDMRSEEKANLATLFGILDGTIGPKNGRWFLICDANTMHMDDAMTSRLNQTPIKALGPTTPEHFVRLLRDIKLKGRGPWLPISDSEWLDVGRLCVGDKLSGRSADAVAGRVLTEIEDFEEPDEYFKLSFEEKQKMIAKLSKKVDAKRMKELIDEHVEFEKEAQTAAEESRFKSRVEEIELHLSAQQAALKALALGKAQAG